MELENFARWLLLSDEQQHAMRGLFMEYEVRWNENLAADWNAYTAAREIAVNASRGRPDLFTGDSIQEAQALANRLADRLRSKVNSANDDFFNSVHSILSEEQSPRMSRARLGHHRFEYGMTRISFRERDIDPIELVEQLPLSNEERAAVEVVIADYEPIFVHALIQSRRSDDRSSMLIAAAADRYRPMLTGEETPTEEAMMEVEEIYADASAIREPTSQRLVDTIRSGINRFAEVLAVENAELFRRRCNELAYPEVYPDPLFDDSLALYDTAMQLESISHDQRESLRMLRAEYINRHTAISKKMAERVFDIGLTWFKQEPGRVDDHVRELKDAFRPLGLEREQLNKLQWSKVAEVIEPELFGQLPKWEYADSDPPRPWEPDNWGKRT